MEGLLYWIPGEPPQHPQRAGRTRGSGKERTADGGGIRDGMFSGKAPDGQETKNTLQSTNKKRRADYPYQITGPAPFNSSS